MINLLLYGVPVGALILLALIYFVPRHLIPATSSSKREDIVSVIQARNEIRKTAAQLLAGAAFVLTFIASTLNFNRDFAQRTSQAADDLYAKAIAQVSDTPNAQWQTIGAFYLLAELARQYPKYHYPVLTSMAQYLVHASKDDCATNKDSSVSYKASPRVQLVSRVFADHDVSNDYEWSRFHLDGACLTNIDLHDAVGLQNLWMPNVRLIRADLRNTILRGSYFADAVGGIFAVSGMSPTSIMLSSDVQKREEQENVIYKTDFWKADLSGVAAYRAEFQGASFVSVNLTNSTWKRAKLDFADFTHANLSNSDLTDAMVKGANFEGANFADAELVRIDFTGVNLKGANFKGADIAQANLENSTLTMDQLTQACVNLTSKESTVEQEQPKLPQWIVDNSPGGAVIIPKCHSSWAERIKTYFTRSLSDGR